MYNIITQRGFAEPVKEYNTIGSGVPYGSFLLEKFWNKEMTMKDFARVAYMVINYVIELKLDDSVGGVPHVWFIPDALEQVKDIQELDTKYPVRKATQQELDEMKQFSDEKLNSLKQFLDNMIK